MPRFLFYGLMLSYHLNTLLYIFQYYFYYSQIAHSHMPLFLSCH
ncbi:hypothetical protein XBKQ1_1280068 [Xenorhabdus bovienii str. kraussei Quebec]|uniref:Uncharacterized protein n=1 Tax=Xenorhabdus bovienii str. kraussei Quebec TaxID=1398203 RepID=A0A077PCX5_XENBV|nr:hypothetical protein XBKQ1_1280068 [Xenorhabdus bovienii str. kraussei Quebec]